MSSNSKLIDRASTNNRNAPSMHGTELFGESGSISRSNVENQQMLEEEKVSEGIEDRDDQLVSEIGLSFANRSYRPQW